MNDLYPIFLKVRGRRALVVGGGQMAVHRVGQLVAAGAEVTVIALEPDDSLVSLARAGTIALRRRAFARSDVTRDYFLVVGATDDPEAQRALADQAEELGMLYNVVDSPARCNFHTPAVVERGDLKIAISTNGESPVLARRLREELEAVFPAAAGEWLKQLGSLRARLRFELPPDLETRKRIIEEVIERTVRR